MCRVSPSGAFEFWGVFVEGHLAGFAKCAVGPDYSATLVLKLDPNFMPLNTGPVLQHALLNSYVTDQRKAIFAGFRSIVHDTNAHDYLLKSGYSRVYCDLKVEYRPTVQLGVNLLYSYRGHVDRLPESTLKNNLRGLLAQEEIRRLAEWDGKCAIHPSLLNESRALYGEIVTV
jgi:hypothetical protein